MGLIKLITGIDIEEQNVVNKIRSQVSKGKFIYITSTLNIKEIRQDAFQDKLIPYHVQGDLKDYNLFTFAEFQRSITDKIYSEEKYISTADQKYILSKLITDIFNGQPLLAKAFEEMKHELFELYKFLMFYEIKTLNEDILDSIERDYSNVESSIFKLYNAFITLLNDIIPDFNYYKDKEDHLSKLAKQILIELDIQDRLQPIQNKLKLEIYEQISKVDKLLIDGFLFFNDIQKFVIQAAVNQGKQVIIVAKYSISDSSNSFLLEDNYLKLAEELGQKIVIPYNDEDIDFKTETALNYLQMKYPEIDMRIGSDIRKSFHDSSIKIINSFSNRDDELIYIAKQISNRVKDKGITDHKEIKEIINKEHAIVLAVEKEKYEERFTQIFEEIGVFLLKEHIPEDISNIISFSSLEPVLYNKADYLQCNVLDNEGNPLSFDDKYKIFKRLYQSIRIHRKPRPIASYPIGQYIFQIYNIATEGMTIEGFKMLLYSNWQYVSNQQEKNNLDKWDKYISEFKKIQTYFEDKKDLADWLTTIEDIFYMKKNIANKAIYKWHPYNHIEEESILFFISMLSDLDRIVRSIKDINGSVVDHINELRTRVMATESILEITDSELNFEQKVVKKLGEAVKEIGGSSLVKGLSINYFAENLSGMLHDWEEDRLEDEDVSDLKINVVNLENMKKYKHVYFMMLESNKYPRKYSESFPFTPEILSILKDDRYGIKVKPSHIHGLDYHLKLEQYLFKNVLDFTTEEIIITHTEKEDSNINKPSIYIEDITSIFDLDIKECYQSNDISSNVMLIFDGEQIKPLNLDPKDAYTSLDLAIYLLCPRLYFHLNLENQNNHISYTSRFQLRLYAEAILYQSLMEQFKLYNQVNKKNYSVHENEYYYTLKSLLDIATKDIVKYFSFFSDYDIKDIKNGAMKKALFFIKSNVINFGKHNCFTILNTNPTTVSVSDFGLTVGNDTLVRGDKGEAYYQTSIYLEFLVLKTLTQKTDQNEIDEIIEALKNSNEETDRINLTLRLIQRINLGIKHGSIRYKECCKNIINEIIKMDYHKARMMQSKFCMYCKIGEICKGHLHVSKEGSNELL